MGWIEIAAALVTGRRGGVAGWPSWRRRGKQPAWVKDELAGGKNLEDLAI